MKSVSKDAFGIIIFNDDILHSLPENKNIITTHGLNISVRYFIKSAI